MGTDFINDLDINYPDGDVHKVPVLDDDNRKTKDAIVNTVGAEHDNATGEHTIPVVTDAQEAGLNQQDGRLIWNSDDNVLKINITAAWLSLIIPAGTKMVFDQDAAPAGWTRDTSQNDRVIRIVSGARADGGSWTISGITVDNESAHSHSTPNHVHPFATSGTYAEDSVSPVLYPVVESGGLLSAVGSSDLGGTAHPRLTNDTTNSGSGTSGVGSAHGHGLTYGSAWRPLHRDMIVATKD